MNCRHAGSSVILDRALTGGRGLVTTEKMHLSWSACQLMTRVGSVGNRRCFGRNGFRPCHQIRDIRLLLGLSTAHHFDNLSRGPNDHGRDQPWVDRRTEGKEPIPQPASSPTTLFAANAATRMSTMSKIGSVAEYLVHACLRACRVTRSYQGGPGTAFNWWRVPHLVVCLSSR